MSYWCFKGGEDPEKLFHQVYEEAVSKINNGESI